MKKLVLAVLVLCLFVSGAWADVEINATNFPDANFRNYVSENFDTNNDGSLSDSEISSATNIDVHNKNITSLKGIEYFTNLTILDCAINKLITLDISNNLALEELHCDHNQLTEIDISKNIQLQVFWCGFNQLKKLDVSNNLDLEELHCGQGTLRIYDDYNYDNYDYSTRNQYNQLIELDISNNTALRYLSCFSNQLTELDVSKNTALVELSCSENQLTELDVSNNTALEHLYCYGNQLTELDVSKNTALRYLSCLSNQLTELDVSKNTALVELHCRDNQLTELDVSNNTALEHLYCYGNQLTELNVNNNIALTELYCSFNQLTKLDVSKNTALTRLQCGWNQLIRLDISKNTALEHLYCAPNQLTELDVSKNTALIRLYCNNNQLVTLDLSTNNSLLSRDIGLQTLRSVDITYQSNDNDGYPYYLDFKNYMSYAQTGNIDTSSIKGLDKDNNEIAHSYGNGIAKFLTLPAKIQYNYKTGHNDLLMDVTFIISESNYEGGSLDNHVYRYFEEKMTWEEAKKYCEELGGHLVTISTQEELDLVNDLVKDVSGTNIDWWIGAEKSGETWQWITGEKLNETPKEINLYDDEGNFYGVVEDIHLTLRNKNYYIGAFDTKGAYGFICEWDPVIAEFAPLNPEYLKFIENPEAYYSSGDFYGLIPEPVDWSHLENNPPEINNVNNSARVTENFPEKYDPRNSNKLPPIRNQEGYGTCWSFASIGALETSYIAQGFGTTAPDLSEFHQAWFVFKDSRPGYSYPIHNPKNPVLSQGAYHSYSIAFLSWIGPAAEKDLPYSSATYSGYGNDNASTNDSKIANIVPKNKLPEDYEHPLMLKNAYNIGKITAEHREIIKQLVNNYGAVAISFYCSGEGFSKNMNSYYFPKAVNSGHAVVIVGWDDNYSRDNFDGTYKPNNNGAWLIRNSWGTNRHDKGYFWMSYEQLIYDSAVFIASKNTDVQLYGYGHDSRAADNSISYNWAANVFKANQAEELKEIAFHTRDNNINYEIYVNNHGTKQPATPGVPKTAVMTGKMPYAGYHTITLTNPIQFNAGEYFSVIVKLSSRTAYKYASAVEDVGDIRTASVTTAGKSYFAKDYSKNPVSADWKDGKTLTDNSSVKRSCNACIRAFTVAVSVGGEPSITTTSLPVGTVGQAYSCTLNAAGITPITWKASGLPNGLSLNGNNISGTPTTAGTYSVTLTATNNKGTATKTLQLVVNNKTLDDVTITTTSLPSGTVGKYYSYALQATGATPITWSVKDLPSGLSLTGSSIIGTPKQAGSYNVIITAENSISSDEKTLSLTINASGNNDNRSSGSSGGGGGGCNAGTGFLGISFLIFGLALSTKKSK